MIGIDIGGTHFRIGVVDETLQLTHFTRVGTKEVFSSADPLADLSDYLAAYIHRTDAAPEAIVMGFPATVDKARATVLQAPNLPFMEHLPVKEVLGKRLGVPVLVERDVNLSLYYDRMHFGVEDSEVLLGIYFGTGIGNAVMLDGKLLLGKHGVAAELGHIPVDGSCLPCGCGNQGCMENLAGGKYLAHLQATQFPQTPIEALFLRHGDTPQLAQFLHYMALTIATEVNIFDPDCVLIGGGIPAMAGFPWEALVEKTRAHVRKPLPAEDLHLLHAADFPEKGVLGAALYAKEALA